MEFPLTQEQAETQEEIDEVNDSIRQIDEVRAQLTRRQNTLKEQRLLLIIRKHGLEGILDVNSMMVEEKRVPYNTLLLMTVKIKQNGIQTQYRLYVSEFANRTVRSITYMIDDVLIQNIVYVLMKHMGFVENRNHITSSNAEIVEYAREETMTEILEKQYKNRTYDALVRAHTMNKKKFVNEINKNTN